MDEKILFLNAPKINYKSTKKNIHYILKVSDSHLDMESFHDPWQSHSHPFIFFNQSQDSFRTLGISAKGGKTCNPLAPESFNNIVVDDC